MLNITSIGSLCMGCFTQHAAPVTPCPVCGYDEAAREAPPHQLRLRAILNGKYLIGQVLGEGGFGITYIGWDLNLDLKVAIKEYYPSGYVTRETTSIGTATVQPFTGSQGDYFLQGRDKFINEAKALAKFFSLPGIVSIKDYFQENGTAYIVMEYIDGQTLKAYLAQMGGKLPAAQIFDMMKPVMTSLAEIHKTGLIHRDISPDNIMISKEGYMKLLDFGAARDYADSGNKSLSIMLKPGFAPEEQYRTRGVQGPWTDVYALCATIYKCITGVTPEEALERTRIDEVKTPSMLGAAITPAQEAALMKGMAVLQENRYQSVPELFDVLLRVTIPQPAPAPPMPMATPAPVAKTPRDPVSAPAPVSASPSAKWLAKKKAIIIAGVCVAAIAGLIGLGIWAGSPPEPSPSPMLFSPSPAQPSPSQLTPKPQPVADGLIGSWIFVEDSAEVEIGFNDKGKYYFAMFDGDLPYVITEGGYDITGNRIKLSVEWGVMYEDGAFEYGHYTGDEVEWLDYTLNGNSLILTGDDGEVLEFSRAGMLIWGFGLRDTLFDRYYVRTVTLGNDFTVYNIDNPDQQKGWATHGVELETGYLENSWSSWQFTSSRYLILELYNEPMGPFQFVWRGAPDWAWTETNFLWAQGNHLVIDLYDINGYNDYIRCSELIIYVCYWSDNWWNLPLKDAYFANAR